MVRESFLFSSSLMTEWHILLNGGGKYFVQRGRKKQAVFKIVCRFFFDHPLLLL